MKLKWIILIVVLILGVVLTDTCLLAKARSKGKRWIQDNRSMAIPGVEDGVTYTIAQDPTFQSYDQTLRTYLVKRIKDRYGVSLDPKTYSGFQLLNIESFLKCKKPDEPLESFLKSLPKGS